MDKLFSILWYFALGILGCLAAMVLCCIAPFFLEIGFVIFIGYIISLIFTKGKKK